MPGLGSAVAGHSFPRVLVGVKCMSLGRDRLNLFCLELMFATHTDSGNVAKGNRLFMVCMLLAGAVVTSCRLSPCRRFQMDGCGKFVPCSMKFIAARSLHGSFCCASDSWTKHAKERERETQRLSFHFIFHFLFHFILHYWYYLHIYLDP